MAAPTRPSSVVAGIEARLRAEGHAMRRHAAADGAAASAHATRRSARWRTRCSHVHRQRTLVALALMAAQAFFYNAIFFTYALVLTDFYGVPAEHVGWYILPFAAGNVLGPLLLGRLFDTLGRRPMIAFTYCMSGRAARADRLAVRAGPARRARRRRSPGCVIFFFASAAASSAYLTVSETFPLEIRALAIAIFYAVGTGIGGIAGRWLFGALIDTGSRTSVFGGYLLGAALMIVAAGVIAGAGAWRPSASRSSRWRGRWRLRIEAVSWRSAESPLAMARPRHGRLKNRVKPRLENCIDVRCRVRPSFSYRARQCLISPSVAGRRQIGRCRIRSTVAQAKPFAPAITSSISPLSWVSA